MAFYSGPGRVAAPGAMPGRATFIAFSVALVLAAILVANFKFVPLLDHVNLAFHEAGHPIFGLLGNTMHWLGGTLGQFVFPIATTIHFLRRRHLLSAAACAVWGFENLRYTAVYLGDARTRALPLVGGGMHDWHHLLGQWGLLESDTRIAGFLTFISWSGWIAVWLVVYLRYRQGAEEREQRVEAERRAAIIQRARESERIRQSKRGDG